MTQPKSKRKVSQFEVFHHLTVLRREMTDLLLRDFGYRPDFALKKAARQFGGRKYEELSREERFHYDNLRARNQAFDAWFITDERKVIIDCLRKITEEVYVANSIYPSGETLHAELAERRLHQDRAIGQCYRLKQELEYAVETLPVDVNKYLRFSEMIEHEAALIKGWRKSNKKFLGEDSDSAANFANVNSNGNCNYNNASNRNAVRPDFDPVIK